MKNYIARFYSLWPLLALGLAAFSVSAQPTNAPARTDYSAFQKITDNNIFDPNRRPRRGPRTDRQPSTRPTDSFALVGVMSYDQTLFAIFDGSGQYRKAVKPDGTIGDFKVTAIAPDHVNLVAGTNEFLLPIAKKELRREDGEWHLADRRETYVANNNRDNYDRERFQRSFTRMTVAAQPVADTTNLDATMPDGSLQGDFTDQGPDTAAPAAPAASSASGTTDPVLLRLMQRRQQEGGQ